MNSNKDVNKLMLTKKKGNNIQNNSNMYRFRSKFRAEIFSLNPYLSINKI